MAKSSSGAGGDANDNTNQGGGEESGDRIQPQIRDFAQKAADLAKYPVARTMIAAGLVTAAAAMTSNKKVRDNVKKAGRDAADSAEEAAEAASRIGTAVVNAAAEAFRRVMNLGTEEEGGERAGGQKTGDRKKGGASEGRKAAKSAPAKAKSASQAKGSTGGAASKAKSAGAAKSKSSAAGGRSGGKGSSGSSSEGSSGS